MTIPKPESQETPPAVGRAAETPNPSDRLGPTTTEGAEGGETNLWAGRTSWKHYAGRFLLAVVIGIAWLAICTSGFAAAPNTAVAGTGLAVLLLLVVVPVAWTIWSHRYRLTSERLLIERGILSQTIDQTELIRVDDVRIHKTLMNRILGLGTIGVISTDATDREIAIPGVCEPEKLADVIRSRMRALRKKSLYVEHI
jgi:membrane protein YdbS with pleckstrin-like domain